MVASELPFGERTARRFMTIANHPILSKANHGSLLPPSWGTLYELSKLPEPVLTDALKSGQWHAHAKDRGKGKKGCKVCTG